MNQERQIIEFRRVKYQPRDRSIDSAVNYAHSLASSDDVLVYVEGCIKLNPHNAVFPHAWVVDPSNGIAYECGFKPYQFLDDLTNSLKIGDLIPWDSVEYHGYTLTREEMQGGTKFKNFVLPVDVLEQICRRIKQAQS